MDFKDVIKELKIGRQHDQYLAENRQNQDEAIQKELATLNKMFGAFFASQKPTGDDLEEKREKREKKATEQKAKNKPKNFREGFFAGTGLDGILGGVKDLAGAAFAPFAGMLGGMSVGTLFGKILGKSFMGVVGFYLGQKYLDRFVDPIVDKITGDDATAKTMFGEIDISKIVSGIGGALALIFGPRLLSSVIGSYFTDIGGKEGGAKFRLMFLRRLGLAGLILTAASFSGEWLQGLGMGEGLSGAVSMAMSAAGIGLMLLGGKGLIIGAIVGFAVGAIRGLYNYLNDRGREAEEVVLKRTKENTDKIYEEIKAGNDEEAERLARQINADIARFKYNMRGGTTYSDLLDPRGDQIGSGQFLANAINAAREGGQATGNQGVINNANKQMADLIGMTAASVSTDDLREEIAKATKGKNADETMEYLNTFMMEAMSGSVANQDQQRLISYVADNYESLVREFANTKFDRSEGMGDHERGREQYLLPVIENNTGVIDKFNQIIARMIESHSLTQDSLIGRMMGAGQDLIPAEAQGGGGYATYTNIEGSTSTTNNQGIVTGDPRPFDRLVSGY